MVKDVTDDKDALSTKCTCGNFSFLFSA